ncbi:DUF4229 domain-containing protein [uncultured Nocardioides sp.]|uniref:DUF4229 domain-containing protein n=1 Tax=uncultured Nocardioides sp. TaxID=198441 RepID=UPI00262BD538|nr:DUF4229 domain-containing protein [uncultured Nocardioides sp.]
MKEFAVYTGLRIGLFAASYGVVGGIWLIFTRDRLPLILPILAALIISGIASYFLLDRQRDALALRIQGGAEKAGAKLEERRGREDGGV